MQNCTLLFHERLQTLQSGSTWLQYTGTYESGFEKYPVLVPTRSGSDVSSGAMYVDVPRAPKTMA